MDKVILAAIPLFFFLIGLEVFINWRKKKGHYELKDSITNLGSGILNQMNGLISGPLFLLIYITVFNFWNLDKGLGINFFAEDFNSTNGLITWIFGFILTDFLFYWSHRHGHEINLIWATHIAHHSSEEYNLSVALRQPAFSFLVTWQYMLPAALLGVPPLVYFASYGINLIYQFWIHTRSIKTLGPVLEYFLNTPSHHRVHHARQEKYLDKNYGGIFIVWDRWFGTFAQEEDEPRYGVYPRYTKFNAVSANIDPWVELIGHFNQAQGLRNKFNVLFKGPLYIYENFKKGKITPGQRPAKEKKALWYVFPLFILSLAVALVVLFNANQMPIATSVAIVAVVWILTYIVGYVQDKKSI